MCLTALSLCSLIMVKHLNVLESVRVSLTRHELSPSLCIWRIIMEGLKLWTKLHPTPISCCLSVQTHWPATACHVSSYDHFSNWVGQIIAHHRALRLFTTLSVRAQNDHGLLLGKHLNKHKIIVVCGYVSRSVRVRCVTHFAQILHIQMHRHLCPFCRILPGDLIPFCSSHICHHSIATPWLCWPE